MTPSETEDAPGTATSDLAMFFARIDECRDKRSLTHGLHPYPAKFIPELPRRIIQDFSHPGDIVLDPMCGSGTTLVEASAHNRHAIGVDLNPIAVLASRAKTTTLSRPLQVEVGRLVDDLAGIESALHTRRRTAQSFAGSSVLPAFHNREKWFSPQALYELAIARSHIRQCRLTAARTLALCALSAVIVEVSNQESETRWCAKARMIAPGEVLHRLSRRLTTMLAAVEVFTGRGPNAVEVVEGDARSLPIVDASVDLIVTSPPYANSHDYYLYNKLRLFWMDRDVGPIQSAEIGSRNRHSDNGEPIEAYLAEMGDVITEICRVLRPDGTVAIVVADAIIRGEFFPMDELFALLGGDKGLKLTEQYGFRHKGLNRLFPAKFGTSQPKTTHVLIFEKLG